MSTLFTVNIGTDFTLKGSDNLDTTFGIDFRSYISKILPNAIAAAGIILLALIVIGGVGMITNASNPEAQNKSKGLVTNAAIGFGLVFGAYWIIQILQIVTGVSILR